MADDLMPARANARRLGRRPRRPACSTPRAYQVSFYVDHGGECSRVHTESCSDEREARNFTVNMLLSTYMRVIYPHPEESGQRLFWCELVAGRWADGRWEPDPRAGGDVDTAWLDGESGSITFDLAASVMELCPALYCSRKLRIEHGQKGAGA